MRIGAIMFGTVFAVMAGAANNLPQTAWQALNHLSNTQLWADENLWDDPLEEVLARQSFRFASTIGPESRVDSAYLRQAVMFGAPAEQIRIYSSDNRITGIDILFFNKGDSASDLSKASVKRAMRQDAQVIQQALTDQLGKGKSGYWGASKTRMPVRMWTCGTETAGVTLALEFVAGEYVTLHLAPTVEQSQRVKKAERVDDDQDLSKNLERNDRGDVYLKNVPMVDQGSKGYCLPATMERCFLYYGITQVDMHKIADRSETRLSGGTRLDTALSKVGPVFADYGLRMRSVGSPSMRTIRQNIDLGYPMIWTLYSFQDYELRMGKNSALRESMDREEWQKFVKKQKKLKRDASGAHVCLIIGYNQETDEVAVSNSWGASGTIGWIRFEDLQTASIRGPLYAVMPR